MDFPENKSQANVTVSHKYSKSSSMPIEHGLSDFTHKKYFYDKSGVTKDGLFCKSPITELKDCPSNNNQSHKLDHQEKKFLNKN